MDARIEGIEPLHTLMTFTEQVIKIHYNRVGEA